MTPARQRYLAAMLLLATILIYVVGLPTLFSYLIALSATALVGIVAIRNRNQLEIHRGALIAVGVIGLAAYTFLQLLALNSIRTLSSQTDVAMFGLFVTLVIADLFGSASIFGLSVDTVLLGGGSLGYLLQTTHGGVEAGGWC